MTRADRSAKHASTRLLVIRPDRLGDVLLSTPVFEAVKSSYPLSHLTVMIRAEHESVIRGIEWVDDVLIYDPKGRHLGWRGLRQLVRDLRAGQFRIVVVLQSQFRIALATFLSRIRYRVGPLSKLHSFLFYNRGVRQRRSLVEMHEADYNLQLLRRIGVRTATRSYATRIHVPEEAKEFARSWLASQGCVPGQRLVAVHPGMGGSALNWPETHYFELIRALIKDGLTVLLTGGPTEKMLVERLADQVGRSSSLIIYIAEGEQATIARLGGLYSWVDLLVAPSTGPLHLAVALGKPVVSFYPPIRVQSALRWGPYLKDESRAKVLTPEVYCGEDFTCRGQTCHYFPCMKSITTHEALRATRALLKDTAHGTS